MITSVWKQELHAMKLETVPVAAFFGLSPVASTEALIPSLHSMEKIVALITLTLVVVCLLGCSTAEKSANLPPLHGTEWQLVELNGRPVNSVTGPRPITLTID